MSGYPNQQYYPQNNDPQNPQYQGGYQNNYQQGPYQQDQQYNGGYYGGVPQNQGGYQQQQQQPQGYQQVDNRDGGYPVYENIDVRPDFRADQPVVLSSNAKMLLGFFAGFFFILALYMFLTRAR